MSIERPVDVAVIGGGLGGVAAALAAAKLGRTVLLVSECDWVGGQVTSQAIPPDEHPWIESVGCTASYREYRERVRDFYRRNYPLTAAARADRLFNPGTGNIGPLSHEPQVSELVLEEMLSAWTSRGQVTVVRNAEVIAASVEGDEISSVEVKLPDGTVQSVTARFYLDATDLGDLIAAADVEHVVGAESQAQTGEPHALRGPADPNDQQAITWALLLSWDPAGGQAIEKPDRYGFWSTYEPPHWPGRLLSWTLSDHVTNRPRLRPLLAENKIGSHNPYDLWHARRILDRTHFAGDWQDTTCAAWPMMDYALTPLVGPDPSVVDSALEDARQLSLSFLYWMQTEAPRHDGGHGYRELRPRPDLTGGPHGLARRPYIRESRRIQAQLTLLEQHIGVVARDGLEGAERFEDSVGVAAYRIDVHPSTSGRPTLDLDTWPFQLPLRAFVPVRMRNFLPAGKNIGSTHLTAGAYRVHPGEWAVGEAAGAIASVCLANGQTPQSLTAKSDRVDDLQRTLSSTLGAELEWPRFDALTPMHRIGYVPHCEEGG